MQRYDDQHALITGASSGLGSEFARQLHARGARVTLVARRTDLLQTLAGELNALRPESAVVLPADLSRLQDRSGDPVHGVNAVCEYIHSSRVDLLVNNAGFGSFGRYEELDMSRELEMVRVNIIAGMMLARAVIPQMKERGAGAILVLSSVAAFQPIPCMATYAATKCFSFSHAMALRAELKRTGIRVLAVCPGPTETEFGRAASVPDDLVKKADDARDVVRAALAALERNRPYVITGFRSKLMALAAGIVPVAWSTAFAERLLRTRPAPVKTTAE